MKFFIDTANVDEIRDAYEMGVNAYEMGVISGVTTNPSIISKEGKEFKTAIKEITDIIGKENYIFAEVISMDADGMVKEGRELVKLHSKVVVKLPMCKECMPGGVIPPGFFWEFGSERGQKSPQN